MKRKALGKGLSSLIPSTIAKVAEPAPAVPPASPGRPAELRLEVSKIRPNPRQPRQAFDEEALDDLARSLKAQGLLQPVVVRSASDETYELIAGERRWRAAQRAGIHKIPAIIRDVPDERLLELALIENLQREELNAIEEAEAYQILVDDLSLTHNEIAERVGKQRTTIANALRLLNLPDPVKDMVRARVISMGHARALLALADRSTMEALAARIVADGLSVREVELRTKRGAEVTKVKAPRIQDPNVSAAEATLQRALGTKVRIVGNGKKGHVEIHYHTADELQRIYEWGTDMSRRRAGGQPTKMSAADN